MSELSVRLSHRTVRRTVVAGLAVIVTSTALAATAAPASAAPSCAGVVFSGVAAHGPQAVSDRIAEIKGFTGLRFGVVASQGLAQADFCKG